MIFPFPNGRFRPYYISRGILSTLSVSFKPSGRKIGLSRSLVEVQIPEFKESAESRSLGSNTSSIDDRVSACRFFDFTRYSSNGCGNSPSAIMCSHHPSSQTGELLPQGRNSPPKLRMLAPRIEACFNLFFISDSQTPTWVTNGPLTLVGGSKFEIERSRDGKSDPRSVGKGLDAQPPGSPAEQDGVQLS